VPGPSVATPGDLQYRASDPRAGVLGWCGHLMADATTGSHACLATDTRVLESIPSPSDIATPPKEHT
jgi:hypothetical protein